MNNFGIVSAFLSAVLMATIGVFSRYTGLPPEVITFFRLFFGAVFMAIFLLAKGDFFLVKRWPTTPVLLSGVFLAGFILFYIEAMNFTSMANAIMLVYLAPFVASVVAHFFFGERLTLLGLGCIGMALFGFAMMMEFQIDVRHDSCEYTGILYGCAAMILYAGYILTNRTINEKVHVYTRAFWQLLMGAVVVVPFIGNTLVQVTATQLSWLAAIGFFPGFLAILFAVIALHRLPAAMFGTIAYSEAVAVVVFGWALFQEALSPLQIWGCSFILLSGIVKALFTARIDVHNRRALCSRESQ